MKIASATKMALGNKTQNTPSAVATPLPPLKRSQTGNTWPITAKSAAQDIKRKVKTQGNATKLPQRLYLEPARRAANQTAKAPLMASSANVAIPSPFAPERATLVAPMLPLPVWRISSPRKTRTSTYPKGIEPNRKDT